MLRGRRRPDRDAVPRPRGRVALVAHRAEPLLPRGRGFARRARRVARLKGDRYLRRAEERPAATRDRLVREAIWRWVTPRWQRHLERILERERDVDAVVVFTVPMSHFRGIPTRAARALRRAGRLLRRRRADEPARVRRHGHGLQLLPRRRPGRVRPRRLELGGRARRLRELGARRAEAVFWGADPSSSSRCRSRRSTTSSSTATATSSAASGWRDSSASRAGACPTSTSRSAGGTSAATSAARGSLGDVPFNAFTRAISAARINLNITRRAHATVPRRRRRPFELAMAGAAIVSNPHDGIERWFEPGRELLVVEDADEAVAAYRELLDDPARRRSSARARASGRSTSTRTCTARGGCSSCSASACRRPSRG